MHNLHRALLVEAQRQIFTDPIYAYELLKEAIVIRESSTLILGESLDILEQIHKDGGKQYSVTKIWELAAQHPSVQMDVMSLDNLLDRKIWKQDTLKANVRVSPRMVLQEKEGIHWDLIKDADLEYPIIFGPTGKLIDGYHRLAKAVLTQEKNINAVVLKDIELARID